MNIKRFQLVCRFLSIVLLIIAFIEVAVIAVTGIAALLGSHSMAFSIPHVFSTSVVWGVFPTEMQKQIVIWVVTACSSIVTVYISIKGSQLFSQLSLGVTPFSAHFARSLKKISFLLIACDIGTYLAYSLMMTVLMMFNGGGYELSIGFGNSTLIGLAIYCIAGVINYGIELQKLSDDVV